MCYGADLGVLRPGCKPASTCEEGACDPMTRGQPSATGGKSWRANARPPVSVWTVLGSTVTNSSRSSRNEPTFPTASQRTCLGFSSFPLSLCLSPAQGPGPISRLSCFPPALTSKLWLRFWFGVSPTQIPSQDLNITICLTGVDHWVCRK